jgi:hypothetical protein
MDSYPGMPPDPAGHSGPDPGRDALCLIAVAVLTGVGYMAWLGWDQHKTVGQDGGSHGPYEAWQVFGLVGTLGLLAAWSGWRQRWIQGAALITCVMTICFSVDALNPSPGDGLWLVGATLVAVGTMVGTCVVGLAVAAGRRRWTLPKT